MYYCPTLASIFCFSFIYRFAKRQLDGRSFFGEVLHVCYAPEMESVSETRNKLIQRRRDVMRRCSSDGFASHQSSSRIE